MSWSIDSGPLDPFVVARGGRLGSNIDLGADSGERRHVWVSAEDALRDVHTEGTRADQVHAVPLRSRGRRGSADDAAPNNRGELLPFGSREDIERDEVVVLHNTMVLVHGIHKKTQKTPAADIELARRRMKEGT